MLIAVSFGREQGIVAWGIGAAVGFTAGLLGGRGQVSGTICGGLAVTAMLVGKFLTIQSMGATELSTLELMTTELGILNVIFLLLGVGTAFYLGSGGRENTA